MRSNAGTLLCGEAVSVFQIHNTQVKIEQPRLALYHYPIMIPAVQGLRTKLIFGMFTFAQWMLQDLNLCYCISQPKLFTIAPSNCQKVAALAFELVLLYQTAQTFLPFHQAMAPGNNVFSSNVNSQAYVWANLVCSLFILLGEAPTFDLDVSVPGSFKASVKEHR